MAFEFEALVGHLYVVGGRAISIPPPGALCEVAPQKVARGREAETFFTLVTPTDDTNAPSSFYERMSALAAERYFNSSGSVTAGLRDVFSHLNQNLYEHNQKSDTVYEANMICAVLRGSDLIVGRVGTCVNIIRSNGQTRTFPESLDDDDALYVPPLGVKEAPDVRMTQYRVNNGTRIVLSDVHVTDLQLERVSNALMSVDVATVLVGMKELARLQIAMMVVEFVPPDAPVDDSIPAGESTAQLASNRPTITDAGSMPLPALGTTTPAEATAEADDAKPKSRARRRKERGERKPSVLNVLWRHGKRLLGRIVLRIAGGFKLVGRMIDHYFSPESERQLKWLTSPVGLGTVIGLPLLVVGAVLVLWLSGTEESAFEVCLQELDSRVVLARSPEVVNSDRTRIIEAWGHVLTKVEECDALRPDDPLVTGIRAEGQDVTDRLQSVTRIEPRVIESLPQARLTSIVAQGQNLFVLDEENSQVYQLVLADDGLSRSRPAYAIPAMRRGGAVGGFVVGDIIDIAFNVNTNRLVAVDREGVLVQCGISFFDCTAERLLGVEDWGDPVAITTYVGNRTVYVLDSEAQNGQIWRYEESGGSYPNAPSEYFGGDARPVLRGAVDIQIDSRGNIYVLLADGTVTKNRDGRQESFGFTSFPEGQVPNSARSLFVDDTPTSQSIYIVSQLNRTIFETSFIGNFNASFRVFDESLFELVEDVIVLPDPNRQEIVYAVSGNTVFALPKGG